MNSVSIIAALKNDIMELLLENEGNQTRTTVKNLYGPLRNYIDANMQNLSTVYILSDVDSINMDFLPLIQICKARDIEVYACGDVLTLDSPVSDIGFFEALYSVYDLQKKCNTCRKRTPALDKFTDLCPYMLRTPPQEMESIFKHMECILKDTKILYTPTEIPTKQISPVDGTISTEHWDIERILAFNTLCDKIIDKCTCNDPFARQWGYKKGRGNEKDGRVRVHINRLRECLLESATDKGTFTWKKHKRIIDNLGDGNYVETLHEANKLLMSIREQKDGMELRVVRHGELRVLYRLWRMLNNEHFLWFYGEVETALTNIKIRKNKEYLAFLLYEMKEFIKNYNNSMLQNPWCRLEVNVTDVYNADDVQWCRMVGEYSPTPAFFVQGCQMKDNVLERVDDTLERYADILSFIRKSKKNLQAFDPISRMPILIDPLTQDDIYPSSDYNWMYVTRSELSYNFLDELYGIVKRYSDVLCKDERLAGFDYEKIILEKRIYNYMQNMVERKLVTRTQSGTYVAAGKKTMELALFAIIARIARPFCGGEYVSWEGDHFSYIKDVMEAIEKTGIAIFAEDSNARRNLLEKYSLEGFLQVRNKVRLEEYEEYLTLARDCADDEAIMMYESICKKLKSEQEAAKIRFDALEGLIITQHNGSNVKGPYAISPTSYRDSILHLRHKRPSCIIRKKKDGTIEELPTNPDFVYPYEKAIAIVDAIRRYGYEYFTTFPGCIPEDHLLYNYRYKDIEMVTEPTKDILE